MKENGELNNRESIEKVAMNERNVNKRNWRPRPIEDSDQVAETLSFPAEFPDFDLHEPFDGCRYSIVPAPATREPLANRWRLFYFMGLWV